MKNIMSEQWSYLSFTIIYISKIYAKTDFEFEYHLQGRLFFAQLSNLDLQLYNT